MFYVYKIIDPRNNKIFYIGKGKGDRINQHLYPSYIKRTKTPTNNKIKKILKEGFKPKVEMVKDNLSENEAFELENKIIDKIGYDNLTNIMGGFGSVSGFKLPEETRRKIAEGNRGKKQSKETIEKIRKAKIGFSWGKHTEEHKMHMSEVMKGNRNGVRTS